MKKLFTNLVITLFFIAPFSTMAQKISGTVRDIEGVIVGASVSFGNGVGTTSNEAGKYSISLSPGKYTMVVSFLGYKPYKKEITLSENDDITLDVSLESDAVAMDYVVIVGTRTKPRSSTSTPLPVDVISAKEITSTAQNTFDKVLQYRIPSFNTVQTPVNDATSLLDPYEIRNLGPSRTLILINGKRKNLSSLLYIQASPGVGETGADLSAIPMDAIKRVEVLRDGASAQYGSDAIAGVMNVILKDDSTSGSINVRTGITSKGDGEKLGISFNNGVNFNDKGYMNYTLDLFKEALANRPGIVSAEGDAALFGANINDVNAFLKEKPDAGNVNGSPENSAVKFVVNGGNYLSKKAELYYNAAYINKRVNSFANYRTPYWQTTDYGYLTPRGEKYMGYGPTFQGNLQDYNATVGARSVHNAWNTDISYTTGGNSQHYYVTNTLNYGIETDRANAIAFNTKNQAAINAGTLAPMYVRPKSPTNFQPGGVGFKHHVGNLDLSKVLSDKFSVGLGAEYRAEQFEIQAGDEESYIFGGAQSYAGNDKSTAGTFTRNNIGGYVDLAYDVTPDFLLNGTIRDENYSDFGNAFVYKFSSRYKFLTDKITLRGSYSTGFRAPTLHQIYSQKAQYTFVNGIIQISGLLNNVSKEAFAIGVPKLKAEQSKNITLGMGFRPLTNLSITLDYYNILINDRIILSNTITRTAAGNTSLDSILQSSGIVNLQFFSNAINSRTSGIDYVISYRNIELGSAIMAVNLSGNITLMNEQEGEVNNPPSIAAVGKSVVGPTYSALMFTSRPKYKTILGIDLDVKRFVFSVNNTLFGPAEFRNDGMDANLAVVFLPKVVTDLGISYRITDKTTVAININNLLNVLPEWEFKALNNDGALLLNDPAKVKQQSDAVTFNQRYPFTHDGSHFSQLGTLFNLSLNVQL